MLFIILNIQIFVTHCEKAGTDYLTSYRNQNTWGSML